MRNLQPVSRRLRHAGFMVTFERPWSRLWVGDGKGRALGYVYATPEYYRCAFRDSHDYAMNAETVVRWFTLDARNQ